MDEETFEVAKDNDLSLDEAEQLQERIYCDKMVTK